MMPLSPKENLAECWAFIKAYYVAHRTKHRYAAIEKVSMFVRKKGGPKLRGKAGEVKGLGPAMLALWESKMNAMLETHKQIRLMLLLNAKMESLLELHHDEFKLPESASKQFIQYGFGMAQCQTVLAQHYENEECGNSVWQHCENTYGLTCRLDIRSSKPCSSLVFRGRRLYAKSAEIGRIMRQRCHSPSSTEQNGFPL
jgi:hypothetical protein